MKLGKYISILISTIILFSLSWILTSIIGNEFATWKGFVFGIIMIIISIYSVSIVISIIVNSVKILTRFKKDQAIWKLLTIIFGIGMILFSILITSFAFIWIVYVFKNGIFHFKGGWTKNVFEAGKSFILGIENKLNTMPFNLFVTQFVLILIWSGAGIAYEVVKKIFGGSKNSK